MRDWETFNASVISEFRTNNGSVERFGDLAIVILHTIGARSDSVREIPLIPVFVDDRMLLFGTAAGAATHPSWYFNLMANPTITVEYGTETFTADVLLLPEAEGEQIVLDRAASTPQLADYVVAAAPRVIPVFEIIRL